MPNSTKQICMKHFDISDKGASIRCGNTAKAEKDQRSWIQVCGSLIKDKLRLASSASSSVLKQRFEFGFGARWLWAQEFPSASGRRGVPGTECHHHLSAAGSSAPLPAPAAQPQSPQHRAASLPRLLLEFLQPANVSYLFIGSFQQKWWFKLVSVLAHAFHLKM